MNKTLQVLIVEDSADEAELLIAEFTRCGYATEHILVETLEEMINALDSQEWDIVLSDYSLSRFSATEALSLLSKSGKDLPFIIISGAVGEKIAVRAMRAGAHDFIMKSNLARLIPTIEQGLREADARKKHRSAEIQLKKLYRAVEQSPVTVVITDANGNIEYVNPKFTELTGYTFEEAIGQNPRMFKSGEHGHEFYKDLWRSIESGHVWHGELHNRKKNGELYWEDATISPITDDTGKVTHYVAVKEDITARKESQEKIREEMDITKNLLKITEASARTTDVNQLLRNVVECTRDITVCDITLAYLWDKETMRFMPAEGSGLSSGMIALFKTEPIDVTAHAINDVICAGSILIDTPESGKLLCKVQQEGFFRWIEDISMLAVIPIMGRSSYLGLLVCICQDPAQETSSFSERTTVLLESIAKQLSIAIEEARLHKEYIDSTMELQRKIETIQTMNEISKTILSVFESKDIFETAMKMISKLIYCDWVRVITVNKARQQLCLQTGIDDLQADNKTVEFEATSIAELVNTARPQYIADLSEASEHLPLEKDLLHRGFLSVLRVPVIVKDEVVGVLDIMAKRRAAFSPEDLKTIERLASQIGVALENARLVKDLEELYIGTVRTLAATIDAKSPWTHGHSERVTEIALRIGVEMGLGDDVLKDFNIAGLLHDIGKLGTYEAILDKPGILTADEMREIRKHPGKGAEILAPIKQLEHVIPIIKYHHEAYDGNGYPDGLKGEKIPLLARILAVADTADAMGADRPYRAGLPMQKILKEFKRCSGTQFDPKVVDAFFKVINKPVMLLAS